MQSFAPAAEPLDEAVPLDSTQLADRANALLMEELLRLRTDAGDDPDGQAVEEFLNSLRSDDRQAIGLLAVGGDLRDQLVRPEADRARETFRRADLRLERSRLLDGRVEASQ